MVCDHLCIKAQIDWYEDTNSEFVFSFGYCPKCHHYTLFATKYRWKSFDNLLLYAKWYYDQIPRIPLNQLMKTPIQDIYPPFSIHMDMKIRLGSILENGTFVPHVSHKHFSHFKSKKKKLKEKISFQEIIYPNENRSLTFFPSQKKISLRKSSSSQHHIHTLPFLHDLELNVQHDTHVDISPSEPSLFIRYIKLDRYEENHCYWDFKQIIQGKTEQAKPFFEIEIHNLGIPNGKDFIEICLQSI